MLGLPKTNFISLSSVVLLLGFGLSSCGSLGTKKKVQNTTPTTSGVWEIKNSDLSLQFQQQGGALTSSLLSGDSLNPLDWALRKDQMPANNQSGAPFAGHFLCLGRWGGPSTGEIAAGIPHNGEQSRDAWTLVKQAYTADSSLETFTECGLPLEKMWVKRQVSLPKKGTSFTVKETIINGLAIGRLHNMVQHATLGGTFLDTSVYLSSNVGKGFNQQDSLATLDAQAFSWPQGRNQGQSIDLRSTLEPKSYCVSLLIPDSSNYGWIVAANPKSQHAIGYLWKKSDYPWLNIWHEMQAGKPWAKGIEFGTCGMGQPYERLLRKNAIFQGKRSYEYIDAGAIVSKQYIGFRFKVPTGTKEISQIQVNQNTLVLSFPEIVEPLVIPIVPMQP